MPRLNLATMLIAGLLAVVDRGTSVAQDTEGAFDGVYHDLTRLPCPDNIDPWPGANCWVFQNERGQTILTQWEDLVTNQILAREVCILDDSNRVASRQWFDGADVVVDGESLYFYDDNGNEVRVEHRAGGGLIRLELREYDPAGNCTAWETLIGPDLLPEGHYTYTYDGAGNRVTQTFHRADGTVAEARRYTFDLSNRPTTTEVDQDLDGNADLVFNFSYDARGNQIGYTVDHGGDGSIDSTCTAEQPCVAPYTMCQHSCSGNP